MSSLIKAGELSVSIFGESHGNAIGCVIDGIEGGEKIDMELIGEFMSRRSPGKDRTATARKEKDIPKIMSGVTDGTTTGTPICAIIENTDMHSADYKSVSHLARPGHADYTGYIRYNGANDLRGGGHFSGRLTAPLCFAGALCGQLLEKKGIFTGAHIHSIKNIRDTAFDPVNVDRKALETVKKRFLPLIDTSKDEIMREVISKAASEKDSVGGTIECAAVGIPAGIGSPMFDGLENRISQIVFGIPAIKGIEFGIGFGAAEISGKENNDEFYLESGTIKTVTNNHGGILGGISSGMPIIFRVAVKPTPSIACEQKTVDYEKMTEETIEIKGRHDPCIVPRAVPCVEAALNIALLSYLI